MTLAYQAYKAPLNIQLELTSACNHKCIHCYNFWREPGEIIGTMSRENLHAIINNLIKSEVNDIVITGGEPLLFPELLLEALDLAQRGGIKCSINTNLALITNEIAFEIKKRNVSILTSFPSHRRDVFEKIVNKESSFDAVIQGITIALSHGIHVAANMVVMQDNKDQIIETGRFLHGLGIRAFTATKVTPSSSCKNPNNLRLKPADVISIMDSLLYLRNELKIGVASLTCYPMCLFSDMNKYGELILPRSCAAGKTTGTIGSNGDVRPCSHSDEICGNAVTESLLDIWPRLLHWRNGSLIPEVCHKCKWVKPCSAGCRVDAKAYHNCGAATDPYLTEAGIEKIVMPIAEPVKPIADDLLLKVNPKLRFREEHFGTVLIVGKTMRTVTTDSARLLKEESSGAFTIIDISGRFQLDVEDVRIFFSQLLEFNFIIPVTSGECLGVDSLTLC